MPQFQLTKQSCKVDNFNPRAERHGDSKVPAGDIRITVSCHSSILDTFHKGLRPLLFRKPDLVGEIQSLFEGDDMTQVTIPNMKPLQIDEDFLGYRIEISEGLDLSSPLVLTETKLSKFMLAPINGGAVKVSFTVSGHPDEQQAGLLCQMIQESPYITVIPPGEPVQQQMPVGKPADTLDDQEAQAERDRLKQLGE